MTLGILKVGSDLGGSQGDSEGQVLIPDDLGDFQGDLGDSQGQFGLRCRNLYS